MKKIVLMPLLAALAAPAYSADSYTVDWRHTYPYFQVSHLGFSTQRGRFDKTSGKIVLDTDKKGGSIDISIDAASVDMGFEDWNKHMRDDEFFDAAKFPAITFKSDQLTFNAIGEVTGADGTLTLRGVSKPAHLDVTNFRCNSDPITHKWKCGADVVTTVKRSEFGMTKYVPFISDDVKVSIAVEAYKD